MNKLKRLRTKADGLWQQAGLKMWKDKCFCGRPAYCCHHFFPKGQYGHLRYDLDNAIPICNGCHMGIHTRGDPDIIIEIKTKRGEEWYNKLSKKAHNTPSSYRGVKWYEEIIEKLEKYINIDWLL